MQTNIPDLSNIGGEIGDYLSADQLAELKPELGISGIFLSKMSARLNQEIHQLVISLDLLKVKRSAKRHNLHIDFQKDIEQAARQLQEHIEKAPPAICNYPKFVKLVNRLEKVPVFFFDIQKNPNLVEIGLKNPYGGKKPALRAMFVQDAHDIYRHFTGKKDWITLSQYENGRYTNPFFHLVKVCYERAGLQLSASTIRNDIKEARKG